MNELIIPISFSIMFAFIILIISQIMIKWFKINYPKNRFYILIIVLISIISLSLFTIIPATSNFNNTDVINNDINSFEEDYSSFIMVLEETQINDSQESYKQNICIDPCDFCINIENQSSPPDYTITKFITNLSNYQNNILYEIISQYQIKKSELLNQYNNEEKIGLSKDSIVKNNIKTENEKDKPLFLFILLNIFLVIFSCIYLLFSFFCSNKLILKRFNAKECKDPEIIKIIQDLSNEFKLKSIKVYLFDGKPNAFAFGFPRSIALSTKLISFLSKKELSTVIRHELAHIKNNDIILKPILNVIRILFFYNPIIHIIYYMILKERELIADSLFIRSKEEKISFIETLLKIHRYSNQNKLISKSIVKNYPLSLFTNNSKKLEINDRFNNLFVLKNKKTFYSILISIIIIISNISMIAIARDIIYEPPDDLVNEKLLKEELGFFDENINSNHVKCICRIFEDSHPELYKKYVIYYVLLDIKNNDLSPMEIMNFLYPYTSI